MTVTAPPVITVSVSPASVSVSPGGTASFSATVSGTSAGQSTAVTWSVQEGSGGGSVDAGGRYTAPSGTGTFHVVATSVADTSRSGSATVSVTSSSILDPDRRTVWAPGVPGGIPARTQVCATVNASTYGNGSSDATAGIQAAINACPAGQVVQLSAGTFTVNGGNYLLINKGITLRGAGPGSTTLQKTDGAKPGQEQTGPNPSPLVIIGPARWDNNGGSSVALTADAVKGAYSVTVSSTAGLSAGQIVLLDELSGAGWQPDPAGRGQIWASPDFRVVWQRHNPSQGTDDPFPDAAGWFSRDDRPTNEIKEIDHLSGNTIFFSTPVHISYRTSHTAQVSTFGYPHTRNAGIEDLTVIGGDQGNVRFHWAAELLGEADREHRLARRGFRPRAQLPGGDPRLVRARRGLGAARGRGVRDQPLRRNRRGTGGELDHPQGQQGDGGPLGRERRRCSATTTSTTATSTPTPAGSRWG